MKNLLFTWGPGLGMGKSPLLPSPVRFCNFFFNYTSQFIGLIVKTYVADTIDYYLLLLIQRHFQLPFFLKNSIFSFFPRKQQQQ